MHNLAEACVSARGTACNFAKDRGDGTLQMLLDNGAAGKGSTGKC